MLNNMVIRFDTNGVPEPDRPDYLRTAMLNVLSADCTIEPRPAVRRDTAFGVSMQAMQLGSVQVLDVAGSPYRSSRQGPGRDDWLSMLFQLDGCASVREGRKSTQLVTGDACLVPPDRDIVVDRETQFRQVILDVPLQVVEDVFPGWQEALVQRLDADRAALAAVGELLRFIVDQRDVLDGSSRDHLAEVILRLLPRVLRPASGSDRPAGVGLSRMASYQRSRVERFVMEHLRDARLSVDWIARELGLSTRYIHKLFGVADGPSVMQWVMEQRLLAARNELLSQKGLSVGQVAYSWGFNSLSHFSRAFKKRFGIAPSATEKVQLLA